MAGLGDVYVDTVLVFLQFMGYDVGNNMVHVGGTVTTMFPADGGQIKVEKTEFVHGKILYSTIQFLFY